jgi:hypothetical protein
VLRGGEEDSNKPKTKQFRKGLSDIEYAPVDQQNNQRDQRGKHNANIDG